MKPHKKYIPPRETVDCPPGLNPADGEQWEKCDESGRLIESGWRSHDGSVDVKRLHVSVSALDLMKVLKP